MEIQFGERVGHVGWFNGPKLFRLEAYPYSSALSLSWVRATKEWEKYGLNAGETKPKRSKIKLKASVDHWPASWVESQSFKSLWRRETSLAQVNGSLNLLLLSFFVLFVFFSYCLMMINRSNRSLTINCKTADIQYGKSSYLALCSAVLYGLY